MSHFDREILFGFVEEANGYLPAMRAGMAAIRAAPTDGAILEETHRYVHTIKGAAAMVGLAEFSHIAFHLEEIVERLMHEPDGLTPELDDGIGISIGHIEKYLGSVIADAAQPELVAVATRRRTGVGGRVAQDRIVEAPGFGPASRWLASIYQSEVGPVGHVVAIAVPVSIVRDRKSTRLNSSHRP